MSAQVIPTVPPRPARSQQVASQQGVGKLPDIPPRPINKRIDRSISPANFPRSPLNEPWSANLSRQKTSERESLPRPPSVQNLPSIGQEGMEYAEIMDVQTNQQPPTSSLGADAAAQTRNIGQDLKLYAPKPSLPKSSATAQVQAVTRTDSTPAPFLGVAGFGKPPTPSIDENDHLHQVRTRSSFSRPGSAIEGGRPSTEGSRRSMDEGRRLSIYGDEQGPAELGLRVPINPLLGDVQAPSPAPHSPHTTGNNTEKRRSHHSRTKSGRETFAPPGSYGLHSHGQAPQDKFEKDWYAKHPEVAQFEETHGHGVYESIGSGRGSFALSSDDLNQIVRNTASRASNLGKSAFFPLPFFFLSSLVPQGLLQPHSPTQMSKLATPRPSYSHAPNKTLPTASPAPSQTHLSRQPSHPYARLVSPQMKLFRPRCGEAGFRYLADQMMLSIVKLNKKSISSLSAVTTK